MFQGLDIVGLMGKGLSCIGVYRLCRYALCTSALGITHDADTIWHCRCCGWDVCKCTMHSSSCRSRPC